MRMSVLLMAEPSDAAPVALLRLTSPEIVRAAALRALADAERTAAAFADDEMLAVVSRSEARVLRSILLAIDGAIDCSAAVN